MVVSRMSMRSATFLITQTVLLNILHEELWQMSQSFQSKFELLLLVRVIRGL